MFELFAIQHFWHFISDSTLHYWLKLTGNITSSSNLHKMESTTNIIYLLYLENCCQIEGEFLGFDAQELR